jgi:hypothetical protein
MSWLSDAADSVAGSIFGSAVQGHYNSAASAQQNAWNVENYKHRYQWAMEDMRNAGLNPILAATNGIGGSIAGASAASIGMPDVAGNISSARGVSASSRQAKVAENLSTSQIEKNVADAKASSANAGLATANTTNAGLQNKILQNDVDFKTKTFDQRVQFEFDRMKAEIDNLHKLGQMYDANSLNATASALRANSAAAFDSVQTELAGYERDFYKSLGDLGADAKVMGPAIGKGVAGAIGKGIGFLRKRYFGR